MNNIKITNCSMVLFVFLSVVSTAPVAKSQTLGLPGQGVRERNRAMDDHDRAINRMKNDARAVNERRRNLFPQINEDFQRIQQLHNEIVRMLQPEKGLNYDRLADLTGDMKKRGARLRENLALSEAEETEAQRTHSEPIDDAHIKKGIAELHDLVVRFVGSPLFKNLGVVDAKVIDATREDLDNIISVCDEIKRDVKILNKSEKK